MALSMQWNGDEYAKYNQIQREWAEDFVQRCLHKEFDLSTKEGGAIATGQVLDLGCGDGSFTEWLARIKLPRAKVLGLDPSKGQIDHALAVHGKQSNLSFQLGSATELPDEWKERFDAVFSFTAMHWVEDHHKLLREVNKVLRKGGLLAYTMVIVPLNEEIVNITESPRWKSYFEGFTPKELLLGSSWIEDVLQTTLDKGRLSESQQKHLANAYRNLLAASGFNVELVDIRAGSIKFENAESMKCQMSCWLPHKQHVPQQLQDEFMNQLVQSLLKNTGQKGIGGVSIDCNLFQVKARKL